MGQTLIVLTLVLLAAAYVGRRVWLALRPKRGPGCAADCGCGAESAGAGDWAKS